MKNYSYDHMTPQFGSLYYGGLHYYEFFLLDYVILFEDISRDLNTNVWNTYTTSRSISYLHHGNNLFLASLNYKLDLKLQ